MKRFLPALAIALAALVAPLAHAGMARASGGSSTGQTVNVYRESCTATSHGTAVGTARFAPDDQGGIPGGLEIRTGLTQGLPRTRYSVAVLLSPCQVLTQVGTLTTDDSGRGDLDVHVAGNLVPAGASLRVRLVASTEVLTSDPTSGT